MKIVLEARKDLPDFPYYSAILRKIAGETALLWIGPAGCVSALNFDPLHNFNTQLFGRKKWVIFPKDSTNSFMYLCTIQTADDTLQPSRLRAECVHKRLLASSRNDEPSGLVPSGIAISKLSWLRNQLDTSDLIL